MVFKFCYNGFRVYAEHHQRRLRERGVHITLAEACAMVETDWLRLGSDEKNYYKSLAKKFKESAAGLALKERKRREYYDKKYGVFWPILLTKCNQAEPMDVVELKADIDTESWCSCESSTASEAYDEELDEFLLD